MRPPEGHRRARCLYVRTPVEQVVRRANHRRNHRGDYRSAVERKYCVTSMVGTSNPAVWMNQMENAGRRSSPT
jgi:hypothetical protein